MSVISTEKKENNIVELEIAVSAEKLKEASDRVYKRQVKSISVPGFRKGKAPRRIIERMYGDGIFLEDAVNDLYPSVYREAIDEAGIEPVNQADVEILKLDKETGFTFKATVTVKPEIEVGEYKGLKGTKTIYPVKDEEIDAEIERMRERGARIISVEDREAKLGDFAVIDFDGYMDGEQFDGGKAEGHQLELGTGSFIDTFEDQIVGHKVGDEFDVNVNFPEEYHAEELKGKPAVFKVKLNEIKEKQLPALDDEFAKDVSEFDTLDELKADIRAKMEEQNTARSNDGLETVLLDEVVKDIKGDIPEVMYDNKVNDMLRDFEMRLSQQGMNLELYAQYTGMDVDTMRESYREQAVRQVKVRLALEAIARTEGFEVTDEDVDKEYSRLAENYQIELEQIKTMLSRKDLLEDILCTKALDLVRESAVVTEEEFKPEPPAEEAKAEEAAEEKPKKAPAKKTAAKKAESEDGEEKAPAKKPAAKKTAAKAEDGEEKPKKAPAKKPAAKKEADKDAEE